MPTGRKNERYNEFSLESHYCNTVFLWGTTLILVTAFLNTKSKTSGKIIVLGMNITFLNYNYLHYSNKNCGENEQRDLIIKILSCQQD